MIFPYLCSAMDKVHPQLSERINSLSTSATLAMSQRSFELVAAGVDVINLGVGEPDFDTPSHIREAACRAIAEGWTRYTPAAGLTSLREAICRKHLRDNGLQYSPSEIIVSGGAKQSVCNAMLSLVNPGDEVIIPAPYWVSYPQMAVLAGGVPVCPSTFAEDGFKLTADGLEAAITPRSRVLVLCTPSNPSGAVYSYAELESLAEVILRHPRLMVISDEVYEHINYTGAHASIAAVPGMKERTAVVNGVSKAYAMTGWRIGWMAAPGWLTAACLKLQGQYTSCPSSVSQKAAEAALDGPQDCVETMRVAFEKRRDLIYDLVSELPDVKVCRPDGAFYLFPDVSAYIGKSDGEVTIGSDEDLAMYILERWHVSTVAGTPFGAPGFLRLSYSSSEESLREAASRIRSALDALK